MSLKQQQQQLIITSGPRVTPVLGECRKQLIALKTFIIIIIIIIIIVIIIIIIIIIMIIIIVIKLKLNRGKEKKIV